MPTSGPATRPADHFSACVAERGAWAGAPADGVFVNECRWPALPRLDRIGGNSQNRKRASAFACPMQLLDSITPARVHEATGQGRLTFALALAGALSGPVLWVQDARTRDGLYAPGISAFMDPAR